LNKQIVEKIVFVEH